MNQRKLAVVLSYIAQIIHILTAIFYTPIMLRILGQSEYGTYQLVDSVVSYLSLFSLGFGSAYIRYYAKYKAENDEEGIENLNGMFMTIFTILAILVVICGCLMIVNIRNLLGTGLNEQEYNIATVLMCFMVFNLAISFPMSVFDSIITAHEELVFQKILLVLQYILNPFVALPLLLLGYGSIGMVCVTTTLLLVKSVVNVLFCFKKLKVKFCFKEFKFSVFKELSGFTFFIFLNQIIEQLNWSVDKFLLGRISGTVAISIYSLASQINMLYVQLSSAVSEAFVPKINRIVANRNDDSELSKLFVKVGRAQFLILALVLSGFILFGRTFMIIWGGDDYEQSYFVALFLLIPITIPLIEGIGIQIQRAKNKHQIRSIVYFFIAIANVFISIPLIKWKGAVGASIGTGIALTLGHVLFMNFYYYFRLGINIKEFLKEIICIMRGIIIPVCIGIGLNVLMQGNEISILCVKIIIYSAIYGISMWLFGMNKEEKKLILSMIRLKG